MNLYSSVVVFSDARKNTSRYRSWGSTEDGQIEFESLSDKTLEGAINVLRKGFFLREAVCICVELNSEPGASEELEELCLHAAKDGVSVVAVDIVTKEVVGVAFNKIQVNSNSSEKSFFEQFSDNCKYQSSKALIDFMINVDLQIDLFKHYSVDCIFEIMFLATLPTHGKQRVGEMLVASSLELAKELRRDKNVRTPVTIHGNDEVSNANAVPTLTSAIMTSDYSYRIAKKLHFDVLVETTYDKFEYNGKKYNEKLNQDHQKCALVAKRLTI
ncbi:hypothetical protein PUN28_000864 [Cardiocondyla obscurior]|uniref:Uncharacterized protein n=1 Tax=Cardiocondyla obscurior TaxID=286306 RepID=A0AAW2H1H5_9HYME